MMMRIASGVVVLALLAGCGAPLPPAPVAARLTQAKIAVTMNNGSTCTAPLAGISPWAGALPECGLSFTVKSTSRNSSIRLAFDAMVAAIKAGKLFAPLAEIVLTDGAGKTYPFNSPVPVEDDL